MAYVADIFKVPTILIKGVTDIVDGNRPTSEEFLENLAAVTAQLDESITKVIDFISGKCLSDLWRERERFTFLIKIQAKGRGYRQIRQ